MLQMVLLLPVWLASWHGKKLQAHTGLRRLLAGQFKYCNMAFTPHQRKIQQGNLLSWLHICTARAMSELLRLVTVLIGAFRSSICVFNDTADCRAIQGRDLWACWQ